MRKFKLFLLLLLLVLLGGLLRYVLPQHDMVRIISTEVIRTDFTKINRLFYAQADSGHAELETRDLRLINTVKKNTFLFGFIQRDSTSVMVYRNEDTGWIWPPYFKFDSADLQAQAESEISKSSEEKWVVMTHYGWRNKYISIYPNAIAIRPVTGPDVVVIPWFNIFFFLFLVVTFVFLRAVWRQFRERTIDPAMEDVNEGLDAAGDAVSEQRGRFRRWRDSWRR